jgi:Transport and Golgi organisation 2
VCLAFLRYDPADPWPVLLASVRDEDLARPTAVPGRWWPDVRPGAVGGRDLRSGGTWLVVDPFARAFVAVFTPGAPTPLDAVGLRSRGELPLRALADPTLAWLDPVAYEPFALLLADARAGTVTWWAWDRTTRLTRTVVPPGFHVGNIAGLDATGSSPRQARWAGAFAASVPDPFGPAGDVEQRWGGWLREYDGALEPERTDALLGRHDTEHGSYGTRSGALVALPADPARTAVYDWSPTPWDLGSWTAAQSRLPEPDGVIG